MYTGKDSGGSKKYQGAMAKMSETMLSAKERKRMDGPATNYPEMLDPDEPVITLTACHHLLGVVHVFELFPSEKRCDVFRVVIDGVEQVERRGWSKALVWVRKAFPRLGAMNHV